VARAALGEAQSQLEALQLVPRTDPTMAIGYVSPPTPFLYEGVSLGTASWRVIAYDEPSLPGTANLKRVVMTVRWTRNTQADSVSLARLWQP
jgi:hypothetical protein